MPRENHAHWMQEALTLANKALPDDVPVGAIIIDASGSSLAMGWNQRELHHDPTAHAEVLALRAAGRALGDWRLKGCILYVTLEPCPMCAAAILQSRLDAVFFGATDPIQGALGSALNLAPLYASSLQVYGGILEKECQEQLQTFFQNRRF